MSTPRSLALLVLLTWTSVAPASPPLRRWFTLRTACCDVTYHDGLEALAPRFARAAQEAHEAAGTLLGALPRERTQLLLTDDTDSSNGSAVPVPANQIRAFVRAPAGFSDLGDFDDWARALILHEVTHIVHTDQVRGLPALVNGVFGKVYPPNLLLPRWFIEGLAVFAETRLTTAGRAQSSLFDMYLRTAALDGRLWDLDTLGGTSRAFPAGNGAYLYGGAFLTWLAEHYGEDAFARIAQRQAGTVFPWAANWAAATSYPAEFGVLYERWRTDLTRRALEVQQRVRAEGTVASRQLTALGQSVLYPRALADGRVAFYAAPVDDTAGLYLLSPRPGAAPLVHKLAEAQSVQGLSPTPDGRSIVFAQPELYANAYSYLDLWKADLATGRVQRLTVGARLRDPDVHPDGRTAMAVENRVGSSRLVLVDLDSGVVRPVFSFPGGAEIHSPRFSPRGDAVVFTAWRPGGFRDVYLLRAGHAQPQRLTADRAMDMHPSFTPDGQAVYFSSDRDGVFNVYRQDLASGRLTRATNAVTGAFMPLPLEPDGALLYVGFHAAGYDLFAQPLDVAALPAAPVAPARPRAKPLPQVEMSAPEPYRPWETLLPQTWRPTLLGSSAGALDLGIHVEGQDLVGYHAYAVEVHSYQPQNDFAWSALYSFTGLPTPLWGLAQGWLGHPLYRGQDDRLGTLTQPMLRGEVGASFPLQRWRLSHALSVSCAVEVPLGRSDPPPLTPDEPAPRLPAPSAPQGVVAVTYQYSDLRSLRDSVSAERGRQLFLRLRAAHPGPGVPAGWVEFLGDYRHFIPVPGLPRHVWMLGLQGGLARGDPQRRRTFVLGGEGALAPTDFLPGSGGTALGTLRGYPSGIAWGEGFLLSTLEWRFPVVEVGQGFFTLPFYADRVHGKLFLDQGLAFTGAPKGAALKRGLGGELWLESTVFYAIPLSLRAGLARGVDPGGQDGQLYGSAALGL